MSGLSQSLQWRARFSPERLALRDPFRQLSFGEFWTMTRRLATWLHREGLRSGETVGVTVPSGVEHLACAHALLRLGCAQVSLATHDPIPMRSELAARCRVSVLVAPGTDDALEGLPRFAPDFEAIFANPALDRIDLPPQPPLDTPALLMASSGTTGRPKIVLRSQRELACYATSELPGGLRTYNAFSVETNAGKWLNLVNLGAGRSVVLADPGKFALDEVCARFGANNVCLFSPKVEAMAKDRPRSRTGGARAFEGVWFLVGGVMLSGEAREIVRRELTDRLVVQYGTTETGGIAAASPGAQAVHPDTVGHPLYGARIRIVDAQGAPLPVGDLGFVQVRTRSCPAGYFNDPEATAKGFRDGWFQPGDVGSLTPDGALIFAGRGDDMMILNTVNIFPAEIEEVAAGWPGVRECAAFPIRSEHFGDVPVLAIVSDGSVDRAALLSACRGRLGMRAPRKIVEVPALPRGTLGKVQRKTLTAWFASAEPLAR